MTTNGSPRTSPKRRLDDAAAVALGQSQLGRIVSLDDDAGVRVAIIGSSGDGIAVRVAAQVSEDDLVGALENELDVVVLFVGPTGQQAPVLLSVLLAEGMEAPQKLSAEVEVPEEGTSSLEVERDAEKLVIEGRKSVTLRCGKSSIDLRADGTITLRGLRIRSHAAGTNRIVGGTVQVN